MAEEPAVFVERNVVVCSMCCPNAEEIAVFNGDYALMYDDGKYHIMGQPGHGSDYIVYSFKDDPFADPDPDCTSEDPVIDEASNRWIDQMQEFEKTFLVSPCEGLAIIEAIEAAGYNQSVKEQEHLELNQRNHTHIMTWFYDYLGKLVDEHKRNKK